MPKAPPLAFTRAAFLAAYAAELPAPVGAGGWTAKPAAERAAFVLARLGQLGGPALSVNPTLLRVAGRFGIRTDKGLAAAWSAAPDRAPGPDAGNGGAS